MRAIVIGAGPAGLAVAACLKDAGVAVEMLERAAHVGSRWHLHYDRLRLHTVRGRSGLPMLPMPPHAGRYPRRADVVRYLEDYAAHFDLAPRFGCAVEHILRDGACWTVSHALGESRADAVVLATGMVDVPRLPDWAGDFGGDISHSSAYRNAAFFDGQRVLVVGFGSSGGDVALDLMEAGVKVAISVRAPAHVLPEKLPVGQMASSGLLGRLTGQIRRRMVWRSADHDLVAAAKGPVRQVSADGRIPPIGLGAPGAIRAGLIALRPGVRAVEGRRVIFVDGTEGEFDAVIAATGYRTDLRDMLGDHPALDADGHPLVSGAGSDGLHFIAYHPVADGQLRRIGIEAREIAKAVAG